MSSPEKLVAVNNPEFPEENKDTAPSTTRRMLINVASDTYTVPLLTAKLLGFVKLAVVPTPFAAPTTPEPARRDT